jgi:ABC-type antimicrobial peptide transport system permease subunit
VLGGLIAGLVVSKIAGSAIEKLLYGVKATDVSVSVAVAGLFLIAGILAAWVPTRRAASIDPMQALRVE